MIPLEHGCDPRIRNGGPFSTASIAQFVPSSFGGRGKLLLPYLEPHGRPLATYCELPDWLSRKVT